jgi:ribosome-interacting GTPase 1
MPRLKVRTFLLLLSLATLSAVSFAQTTVSARPGTLNYVEGQVSIEGRPINPGSVNNTALQAQETLSTTNGKAEILLTPGVFLRLGENSSVQMVSPNLTHVEVRLDRGRANVEVDQIYKQNTILIDLPNGQTQLLKNGLYTFDVGNSTVRVFDG